MSTPAPQRISGEAFAVERLRENPDLDYATLRRLAGEAGVTIQPIQYGRARKQLGVPPMRRPSHAIVLAPQSEAPAAKAAPLAAPTVRRDEGGPNEADANLVAPRRRGSDAFDFLVTELRRDGSLSYADLRAQCEQKGWKIAPIMYGRAKAMLGLVPVKPRGQRKAKSEAAAVVAEATPRTLRQIESVAADRFHQQLEDARNVEQLVAVVKNLDAERRRLYALLEEIAVKIDEALG
ncbi:MAG: hypothetical protein FJ301_06730 [Planctomycetes bacterium]|nr:hypothetical protein [Planctomycetota bacterium]